MSLSFPTSVSQSSDDLPIVIRKGTRSTSNPHHIYYFLNFHRLSLPYFVFVSTLSSVFTTNSTSETLSHLSWKQAMAREGQWQRRETRVVAHETPIAEDSSTGGESRLQRSWWSVHPPELGLPKNLIGGGLFRR